MKLSLFSLTLLMPVSAWIQNRRQSFPVTFLRLSKKDTPTTQTTTEDDPCWQDLYDEDCSMDKAYAATFVAADWIKSMPCGEGIEVRATRLGYALRRQ